MRIECVTGIVLAGGQSRRMGMDKGLCLLNGKPMVSYGLDLLRKVCGQVLVSANDTRYEQFGYPVVMDEFRGTGPIGGLYSSLMASKTDDNIVISCDMPLLTEEMIRLILRYSPGYEAVVPAYRGLPEPFPAYYRRSACKAIRNSIQEGVFKLQDALTGMKVKVLDLSRYPGMFLGEEFSNLNTSSDLDSLESRIAGSSGTEKDKAM